MVPYSKYEERIYEIRNMIYIKTIGEYELALNYYGGINFPIYIKHKCKKCNSHKFWIKYSSVLAGIVKCPICGKNISKGEMAITKYLSFYKIPFEKQYSFSDLVGKKGRRLRFDFGILNKNGSLKFLIEYDGIYHFKEAHRTDE
jgi:hypothetical protein